MTLEPGFQNSETGSDNGAFDEPIADDTKLQLTDEGMAILRLLSSDHGASRSFAG
jgi:hypothetical protein